MIMATRISYAGHCLPLPVNLLPSHMHGLIQHPPCRGKQDVDAALGCRSSIRVLLPLRRQDMNATRETNL